MKFDRFAPFVFVVAVLSVVSFSVTESAADEGYEGVFDVDWGHEPGNGPGKWGVADPGWTLFNEELGQSPIDLANLGAIELPKIESHSPSDQEVAESNQEGVESSGTAPAPAQGAEPAGSETTNGDKPESANDDRPLIKNTYFSFAIGSGITHIDESEHRDDQKQQFKSFDLRFGQHFREHWRVDFIHANEGNPYNHHRDGFAVQATYLLIPSNKIRFEFGTGPYMSFDTTVDEETGEELNEKGGGLLTTAAMIIPLKPSTSGFHLRLQWSNYLLAARANGNSILIGVGLDIDNSSVVPRPTKKAFVNEFWVSWVNTKINHGGPETTTGFSADIAKRFDHNFALSLGWVDEGGYNGATDRQGLTIQAWKLIVLGSRFEARMGAGPYFAKDYVEDDSGYDMKGIISIGVNFYPNWKVVKHGFVGVSLSRVIDRLGPGDDADLFRVSVGSRF